MHLFGTATYAIAVSLYMLHLMPVGGIKCYSDKNPDPSSLPPFSLPDPGIKDPFHFPLLFLFSFKLPTPDKHSPVLRPYLFIFFFTQTLTKMAPKSSKSPKSKKSAPIFASNNFQADFSLHNYDQDVQIMAAILAKSYLNVHFQCSSTHTLPSGTSPKHILPPNSTKKMTLCLSS